MTTSTNNRLKNGKKLQSAPVNIVRASDIVEEITEESKAADIKSLVSEYHRLQRCLELAQTKIFIATNRCDRILESISRHIDVSPTIIRFGKNTYVLESGAMGNKATIRKAAKI